MSQLLYNSNRTVFERARLSFSQIEHWNALQSQYNRDGFLFIEYESGADEEYIWKCILDSEVSTSSGSQLNAKKFDGEAFNSKLGKYLLNRKSFTSSNWQYLLNDIKWIGFFIPVDDFRHYSQLQLEEEINHSYLLRDHFNAKEYLISLKKDSVKAEFKKDALALLGIWQYLNYYERFMFTCFNNESIQTKPIANWHSRNVNFRKFHTYLPSQQLSILLLITIELRFISNQINYLERLVKKSHFTVQNFYDSYLDRISDWIDNKSDLLLSDEMKLDYFNCCKSDILILSTNEILDKSNEQRFLNKLPKDFQAIVKKTQNAHFLKKIQQAITDLSITDFFWYYSLKSPSKPKRYFPWFDKSTNSSRFHWQRITEEEWKIIEEKSDQLPTKEKGILQKKVLEKWSSHLTNLANSITPPIFIWKKSNNNSVVQWNIMDNAPAEKHRNTFFNKQKHQTDQNDKYSKFVTELNTLKSLPEVDKLLAKMAPFIDPILKEKWEYQVFKHTDSINRLHNFRERRMLELGIKKKGEVTDFRTEIWLDEMLNIENEIRQYVPYVKKALHMALPIRKTLHFNDDRHSQSGIEFDPTTINDQNKWLRAEVMKTMKVKEKQGEIEQINAFCLDYSGSMKHERMRNLFKVLYLLVLGLEDRKSYDAFHFFNTNFIEGTNFNEEFTQRNLLFGILSKISKIHTKRVLYGGYMGTNIAAGVHECYKRIKSFKEQIKLKKPDSSFVCSIFVISDGEPSVGITDLKELNEFINEVREVGDMAVKGIYIKAKEDENNFMEKIFGENEFVETVEFDEAINKFVSIMTKTYKEQREASKWKNKKKLQ